MDECRVRVGTFPRLSYFLILLLLAPGGKNPSSTHVLLPWQHCTADAVAYDTALIPLQAETFFLHADKCLSEVEEILQHLAFLLPGYRTFSSDARVDIIAGFVSRRKKFTGHRRN